MTNFHYDLTSVIKIATHGSNQLLLIQDGNGLTFSVYNEHTGHTLMRQAPANLVNLERAIGVLKEEVTGDF